MVLRCSILTMGMIVKSTFEVKHLTSNAFDKILLTLKTPQKEFSRAFMISS